MQIWAVYNCVQLLYGTVLQYRMHFSPSNTYKFKSAFSQDTFIVSIRVYQYQMSMLTDNQRTFQMSACRSQ